MINQEKLHNIEERLSQLKENIEADTLDVSQYKVSLLELLDVVKLLIEENNSLFTFDSKKNIKASLNNVLEAFLTSPYADNCEERTTAILLFKQIDRAI